MPWWVNNFLLKNWIKVSDNGCIEPNIGQGITNMINFRKKCRPFGNYGKFYKHFFQKKKKQYVICVSKPTHVKLQEMWIINVKNCQNWNFQIFSIQLKKHVSNYISKCQTLPSMVSNEFYSSGTLSIYK